MEKTKQKKKIPPLCLALDLFCAGMSLIMLVLTVVGHIRGLFHPQLSVMLGNTVLWLVPFAGRALLGDRIGNVLWAVLAVFCFFASFLGSVLQLYAFVWWYDIAMHTLFGYLGGIIGLFFLCKLTDAQSRKAGFSLLFCFAVSMMFAALWEVFEFSTDILLGGTAQGTPVLLPDGSSVVPVNDTMEDILCNLCGALVFCAQYTLHLLTKKSFLIPQMIRDFSPADNAEKE